MLIHASSGYVKTDEQKRSDPNPSGEDSIDTETLYQRLANEEDARACTGISDSACQEVPGNFFRVLVAQFLTKIGDTMSSSKVVLPWLLGSAGVPPFFTGLLVPIRESGSLLPQLLLGGIVRQFARRKGFYVAGSVLQGVCVGLIALSATTLQAAALGWSVLALLTVFSLSRGLCSVASKDVMGKTIPKARRGRLSGLGVSLSGIITIAVTGGLVFTSQASAELLVLLLVIAMFCWFLAALVFATVVEYRGATDGGGNGMRSAISNIGLLSSDQDFRNFVIVRALLMGSGLAAPYIVLLSTPGSNASNLLMLVVLSGLAKLVSGTVWGYLADNDSRFVMILTGGVSTLIFALVAVVGLLGSTALPLSAGAYLYPGLYFLLAVTHQGVRLGRKTYLVDMADGNKRTDYVTVSNTIIGILLLLLGGLSALLAQFSLSAVMLLFVISGLASVILGTRLKKV